MGDLTQEQKTLIEGRMLYPRCKTDDNEEAVIMPEEGK